MLAMPTLQTMLPGLVLGREGVSLQAEDFSCCGGSGLREAPGGLMRCDLKKRLAVVEDLLRRFHQRWGAEMPVPMDLKEPPQKLLQLLLQVSEGKVTKGKLCYDPAAGSQPSRLWLIGMAAAFRFGLPVHLVTIGRTPVTELYPKAFGPRAPMILVEGVDKLWDSNALAEFEACVAYAYKARAPLWCEVIRRSQSLEPQNSDRIRRALHARIEETKSRDVLSWLPHDVRDRLRAVCDGTNATARDMARATRQPERNA
jgi:hypothetical protein